MNQPDRGVIGIGEPPTVSTAAAIGNAVNNDRPAHPQPADHAVRILDAIAAQDRAGGTL